eukprot:1365989-Amorphochlora_amoeboformis.AAC.2
MKKKKRRANKKKTHSHTRELESEILRINPLPFNLKLPPCLLDARPPCKPATHPRRPLEHEEIMRAVNPPKLIEKIWHNENNTSGSDCPTRARYRRHGSHHVGVEEICARHEKDSGCENLSRPAHYLQLTQSKGTGLGGPIYTF